jgi:hypothetical protein
VKDENGNLADLHNILNRCIVPVTHVREIEIHTAEKYKLPGSVQIPAE